MLAAQAQPNSIRNGQGVPCEEDEMKLGIIGAANVGRTLASRYLAAGHDVLIANSKGPDDLKQRLADMDPAPRAATIADVLACDVVFLAVPWTKIRDVLHSDINWGNRILVDTTNIFLSYAPEFAVDDLKGNSGSEVIASLAPGARVVKAFNTLPFATAFAPIEEGLKRVLFVAGDDDTALQTVSTLIHDIGFHAVALGTLATAGRQMELGGPLSGLELFARAKTGASA
ncbi:NADP oxidoreductase [Thalassospira marina]|uniref:NADP oxidoreductase n=2 Tax=Thalassospira marina TaxID=2048283 RepID=A0A2N3KWS8_9PROT|nr:NADP oxidoreductase [Thalassospira marina]